MNSQLGACRLQDSYGLNANAVVGAVLGPRPGAGFAGGSRRERRSYGIVPDQGNDSAAGAGSYGLGANAVVGAVLGPRPGAGFAGGSRRERRSYGIVPDQGNDSAAGAINS